ncbi:cell division protein ZapE [Shewanella sediminis]|nr:cell division protein ZapE [Shewanella sediminis]
MTLSPLERYRRRLTQSGFAYDPIQERAIEQLDSLFKQIIAFPHPAKSTDSRLKGLYIWGDVGRGKTMLMDLFCEAVSDSGTQPPLRLHFHRFMARIHRELLQESGHREPLARIAKRISKECRLICFDEFFVSDIGDAMILGNLFHALFKEGILLVATSNIPIRRLYENGLQRERFEPSIELLQQSTREIHLDGEADHRLRRLTFKQSYFINAHTDTDALFTKLNSGAGYQSEPLIILGRPIEIIKRAGRLLWLDFNSLCNGPRSQLDYIELASQFTTVLLSDIPVLGGEAKSWIRARGTEDGALATKTGERQLSYAIGDDPARRFIALVDELYDQGVSLYLTAEVPLEHLYSQGALSFEFRRTYSRLQEMQSHEYTKSSKRMPS